MSATTAAVAAPRLRARSLRAPQPELLGLIALAAVLYLWALSRNGWANEYYSAAVRSMSTSWHDFLYASLDSSGVMSVDKPPLSLWVQALSVRAFGFHPLSILVPQALIGVASVVLVYDLVRRRFGRLGGFVAGLALALTPMTVAISRHNNPDALLVLCCVAALWFAIRGLEDGSTRKLVLAGICVGLGFETKMGVALAVVPGIAAAWLLFTPAGRGRLHALRQLLHAGAAMVLVGGAWPALVELTPAADRPWVSGTSDNRILSLVFGYNGLGRVDGQTGGPGGGGPGGGSFFGGSPGPFRLLNSALGGQAGWLLGFALAGGVVLLASTRLRRSDTRSAWLVAVGGSFAAAAILFSLASGIFHPYYVSLLAPFTAAFVGAGAVELLRGRQLARLAAPAVLAAAAACELVVLSDYPGELAWLPPLVIIFSLLAAAALLIGRGRRVRGAALATALGVLLIAPAAWSFDTLGHAESGTFPAGGPASAAAADGPGGFARGSGRRALFGAGGPGGAASQLFGTGAPGLPPGPGGAEAGTRGGSRVPGFGRPFAGGAGAPFAGGDSTLSRAISYVRAHGGGTIAVSSQSSAAQAIVSQGAQVAGIGGFSGRESVVSVSWLAAEVRAGKIRWVLDAESRTGGFGGLPGDSRTGARSAISAAARACTAVSLGSASALASASAGGAGGGSAQMTLYDCAGRAPALERIG